MKEKRWEVLNNRKIEGKKLKIEDILKILFKNRGLKTKKEINEFLYPDLNTVTSVSVEIKTGELKKAIKRIKKAIELKEQIVVFGDYDVDGITGTAILWETLNSLGANVLPYIPHRVEEGYGLSTKGIENVKIQMSNVKLIVTVDNGIVANEAVDFANQQGIDVVITDHHTLGKKLPKAHAIIHTTQVCGAGVAWLLSQAVVSRKSQVASPKPTTNNQQPTTNGDHLSLVALATVADLVPLTGANRTLLKFGLAQLRNTKRLGLVALFKEAQIDPQNIGVYEIGHIIAPRLNAMGRLQSAMDSLRLLCTKDKARALSLADKLSRTNKERQLKTLAAVEHAKSSIVNNKWSIKKLLFIAHEDYDEGIIGLVAGKLVEEFYLPAIVISKGEKVSKASARSISGLNIITFIRTHSHLLINAGGHPMAAGFTVETQNIVALQKALEKLSKELINEEILQRVLKIDCELPLEMVSQELYIKLQELAPFGIGNPEPTFVGSVVIDDIRAIGIEKKHLKLRLSNLHATNDQRPTTILDAIAFGFGEKAEEFKIGDKVDIVYVINENIWNGKAKLELKVKDIKIK